MVSKFPEQLCIQDGKAGHVKLGSAKFHDYPLAFCRPSLGALEVPVTKVAPDTWLFGRYSGTHLISACRTASSSMTAADTHTSNCSSHAASARFACAMRSLGWGVGRVASSSASGVWYEQES